MASAELRAIMEMFTQQMGVIQQQQTAIQAMLTAEKSKTTTHGVDDKYYKRVEVFSGEQAWRDWAFQFKSATKTANEAAYHLLEAAEKEESEIDDNLSLKDAEKSLSAAIFNILGTLVKGEPLQMLHTSGFSGLEAWRKLSKRYSPTTPMRGMQLMMAAINPGKAKKLEEVAAHIDKWEAKVLALSRDFSEKLSDKMKAAILISMLPSDLQHALIQQADKFVDFKSTKDRVATLVEAKLALKSPDAMECDAIHRSNCHAVADDSGIETYDLDVDAVNGKGGVFCYRCGGQGHIAAKCATPAPAKGGKGKDGGGKGGKPGGKGPNPKGKGKGDWSGFCSYCGKKGHGPRDCWSKQRDESGGGRMDVGEIEEDIGGFEIGCVDLGGGRNPVITGVRPTPRGPPGLQLSNRFRALSDEDEPNICPVEKQSAGGRITVDSGAAESVWPEDLMPEVQTKPSIGSQTGVTYIAANGNKMPNLGEKKVHFKTKDGLNSSIVFQVTKVKKPLAVVSKITEKGNWVCFGPNEAYIQNVATGKRTELELHNGTYSLDVEYLGGPGFTRPDSR